MASTKRSVAKKDRGRKAPQAPKAKQAQKQAPAKPQKQAPAKPQKQAPAKPQKQAPAKPQKQAERPKPEFDKAWKEYNSALNGWKEALARWQETTSLTLTAYHEACQKALESDAELLKKVSSSWETTWEEIAPEYIKQQSKMVEDIFKKTNVESMMRFNEQWKKFLSTSGSDSIKAYQEAIKKFNQTWQLK